VFQSDPYRGASNLTGRSRCVNQEALKYVPRVKRIAEDRQCRAAQIWAKAMSASKFWTETMIELPRFRRAHTLHRLVVLPRLIIDKADFPGERCVILCSDGMGLPIAGLTRLGQ
jgi:hypothetical protein